MNTYNHKSNYTRDILTNTRVIIQSKKLCDMNTSLSTYTLVYLQLYE